MYTILGPLILNVALNLKTQWNLRKEQKHVEKSAYKFFNRVACEKREKYCGYTVAENENRQYPEPKFESI